MKENPLVRTEKSYLAFDLQNQGVCLGEDKRTATLQNTSQTSLTTSLIWSGYILFKPKKSFLKVETGLFKTVFFN